MKKKAKEYKVDTLDDLVNLVNKDNFDRVTIDLALWLSHIVHLMDEVRKKAPEETKGIKTSDMVKCSFVWIDDGEHKLRKTVIETDNHTTTIDHK